MKRRKIETLGNVVGLIALFFLIYTVGQQKKTNTRTLVQVYQIEAERVNEVRMFSNLLKGKLTKGDLAKFQRQASAPEGNQVNLGKLNFEFDENGQLAEITTPSLVEAE